MDNFTKRSFLKLSASGVALTIAPGLMISSAFAAGKPDAPTGQVIAGISQEPTVFHPLMPGKEVDRGVWWQLFSTLWFVDDKGILVPDLATELPSVENGGLSEDGLSWKVKLRKGVTWHDGSPFTAHDVKFSLELINNPDFRASSRIGHSLLKDITVVAEDEIHWQTTEVFSPYISLLAQTFIVPKHILSELPDPNESDFNRSPIGTGAFKWGERTAGEHLLLEANNSYHGEGPFLERVVFKYIPDQTVQYTQFSSGEIDYIGLNGIQAAFEENAKKLDGVTINAAPLAFIEYIALNLEFGPFKDLAVRQALYMGMNKQARIDVIYKGRPIGAESYVPRGHWAYKDDLPAHVYDPEGAKAILDEAGWVPGADGVRVKDGMRLAFTTSTTVGSKSREQAQQFLQQNWAEIGAEMTINNMPGAVLWGDFWQKSQFDSVMVASTFVRGGDPDVTARFSKKAIPAQGGSGNNNYQYQDDEMEELLVAGTREYDQEKRKVIYHRIQKKVREELIFLPVQQSVIIEGTKKDLIGHTPNINSTSNAWNMRNWYWIM